MTRGTESTDPTRLNVKTQTVLNAMKALPGTRAGVWLDDLQAAVSQDAEHAAGVAAAALASLRPTLDDLAARVLALEHEREERPDADR